MPRSGTALVPPPRPIGLTHPMQARQRWLALTAEEREQIVRALSRVVANHLTKLPNLPEVKHERP